MMVYERATLEPAAAASCWRGTAPSQEDEALERSLLQAHPPALCQDVSYQLDKVGANEKEVDQRVCMSLLRAKIKCASSCVGVRPSLLFLVRCLRRGFCGASSRFLEESLKCVCGREEGGDG